MILNLIIHMNMKVQLALTALHDLMSEILKPGIERGSSIFIRYHLYMDSLRN